MVVSLTNAVVIAVGGPTARRIPGSADGHSLARGLKELARDLLIASRKSGVELAVLVGGEPLARRDLSQMLQLVSKVELLPGLVTDGRLLANPAIRKLLIERGVAYLRLGLYGAKASTHDALVGDEGAFDEVMGGLASIMSEGPDSLLVDVAITVTATNLDELEAMVEAVATLPRRATLGLRFVAPLTGLTDEEWPSTVLATTSVAAALTRIGAFGAAIVTTWEGFPPCTLPEELTHLRDETLRYGAVGLGPPESALALPREERGSRCHPLPCQECIHRTTCPGVPVATLDSEGEAENILKPTRSVMANSFNYELEQRLDGFHLEAGRCSAMSLALPIGALRSMFFDDARGVSLYTTPTADFTDAQIGVVKDELEQLYLDQSTGAALDDFTTSVRRLRRHRECRECPDRRRCPTAFIADDEAPFLREERWLRKEVSRLRGRVLDVGCGELLYREELDQLIAEGAVEYCGLDPDEETLEKLASSGFKGTLLQGEIEDFQAEASAFDYVLAFRSLNHFRDVARAFSVVTSVLREQGQLLLCDSPPFGMVRTREQVRFADTYARHGHEHFRNWTSHQVVALLRRFPMRLNVHRPVTRETSNQWILKYLRTPGRRA